MSGDGLQVIPEADAVLTDFASGECDPEKHTRKPPDGPHDGRGHGRENDGTGLPTTQQILQPHLGPVNLRSGGSGVPRDV